MKIRALRRFLQQEDVNFLLTNRIPRHLLTHLMGWYSRIESPLLARVSIAVWRLFADLDLTDARKSRFVSLHECFTRELVEGARRVEADPRLLVSPCDAIVGACGLVEGTTVFQAKGYPYDIRELFGPSQDCGAFRDGIYVTLRLTASMYHRFHAPHDAVLEHVTYLSGDTWNVNPVALARVERLFCRNERAVLRLRLLGSGAAIALVPIAAILVASIRLHAPDVRMHLRYRGPAEIACRQPMVKGQEIGWFEHGSTIIVFAPRGFDLLERIVPGARVRMGEALLRLPDRP